MTEINEETDPVWIESVSSEVHLFTKEEILNKNTGAVLSRFEFTYPPFFESFTASEKKNETLDYTVDEDGDLLVKRKGDSSKREGVVIIEHQQSTSLDLVGEQVWRGAFFLADYILHCSQDAKAFLPTQSEDISADECENSSPSPLPLPPHQITSLRGAKVLELASGVGVTSIVAAIAAREVIITDVDRGNILKLISVNLSHNKSLMSAKTEVCEIDFCNLSTLYGIKDKLEGVSVILVADVIYNNSLTDSFFSVVHEIMSCPPNKTLLVALEKRYVFTVADMDTVAPCYEYFLQCLSDLQQKTVPVSSEITANSNYTAIEWRVNQVDYFPQYFAYERTRHLVLWKVDAILK